MTPFNIVAGRFEPCNGPIDAGILLRLEAAIPGSAALVDPRRQEAAMTEIELTELAKAYVALSNSHRVDLILPMFAAGAVYSSSEVGEFRGRAAISDVTRAYFDKHPDVHLQAKNFRGEEHRVSFEFTLTADDGQVRRHGVEHLDFTADGSIKKVTVEYI
jgi:hypothetical protein